MRATSSSSGTRVLCSLLGRSEWVAAETCRACIHIRRFGWSRAVCAAPPEATAQRQPSARAA